MRRLVVLLTVVVMATACDIPRDPEGTLERVTGGTIRVGVSESDPWVVLEGSEPSGVEVEIVERFARELGADIEWHEGTVDELAAALHVGELDLVIAGLTSTSKITSEATLTHPYLTTQVVVAVPPGSEIDEDITGLDVAVEQASEAAGILEKTDARPVRVPDVLEVDGPVAVESYLVDDLGYDDTGVRLLESDQVMAVRHGENAFLVRLERFLLSNGTMLDEILEEHDGG